MKAPVPTISLNDLLAAESREAGAESPDPRELLRSAEVILGQDITSGRQFIVYGRETVEEIAAGQSGAARHVAIVAVELEHQTDDLNKLLALVESLKGYRDYPGGEG